MDRQKTSASKPQKQETYKDKNKNHPNYSKNYPARKSQPIFLKKMCHVPKQFSK